MAVRGIGASFKLGAAGSPSVLDDISALLDDIQGGSDVTRLPTTVFQPDVANPLETEIAGGRKRSFTLAGPWTAAAETLFSALEGSEGISYQYGPEGTANGKKKITGTCTCLNYSGPQSGVNAISRFTVELNVTSRTVGVFP